MFKRLSIEKRKKRRGALNNNSLFLTLYTPLWRRRGEDLSPEEVWVEGNRLAVSLRKDSDVDVLIRVEQAFDDLCSTYEIFIGEDGSQVKRNLHQAKHSAMMVTLTAFLLLLNVFDKAEGHPHYEILTRLKSIIWDIPDGKELYEDIRYSEDEREKNGKFIEVADFIEEIASSDEPLLPTHIEFACKAIGQFVDENKYCCLSTMLDNEVMLSRVNDNNDHCFQKEIDRLRAEIQSLRDKKSENNHRKETDDNPDSTCTGEKIVAFFNEGTLKIDKPHQLYFLLLAMWARRLLSSKEIPAFVRKVREFYPSLYEEQDITAQAKIVMSLQNMNGKANKYFDEVIKDQSTMIEYIDLMYPKKNNGERRKECQSAVELANKLFLGLK